MGRADLTSSTSARPDTRARAMRSTRPVSCSIHIVVVATNKLHEISILIVQAPSISGFKVLRLRLLCLVVGSHRVQQGFLRKDCEFFCS